MICDIDDTPIVCYLVIVEDEIVLKICPICWIKMADETFRKQVIYRVKSRKIYES